MAARRNPTEQRARTVTKSFPAPTRGLSIYENIADAEPGGALVMTNAFPMTDRVRVRRGSANYATGMPTVPIRSLMVYEAGATEKMFAAVDGKIYDASAATAVGSPLVTGLGNDYWQHTIFATTGGTYIVAVNGANTRQLYDGSSWATTPAITGVSSADLANVWSHGNRLWFAEKGTTNAWYLSVDSIGGAAVMFPLGGVFKQGGELVAGGTWSSVASDAINAMCVFISSKGEVALYRGTDPTSSANWGLAGVWQIGRPLGRRCLTKFGGDLMILTEDGTVALSKVMALDRVALVAQAVSRPIEPLWRNRVERYGLNEGWQMTAWPRGSLAIVCLPEDGAIREQLVANTTTGAWGGPYIGWEAYCFAVFKNRLFYGTDEGVIVEAEVTGSDRGQAIETSLVFSFDDFGEPGDLTVVQMMRPVFETSAPIAPLCSVQADYSISLGTAPSPASDEGLGFILDVSLLDVDAFGGARSVDANWQPVAGMGSAIAPAIQLTSQNNDPLDAYLARVDVLYERGGSLV